MDTSKIVFASALLAIADRSVEMTRRLFEIEFIQPFIDKAAGECSLAAEKGLYEWHSEYMLHMDEKQAWFKEEIRQTFEGMGYKVTFLHRGSNYSSVFAVSLEW